MALTHAESDARVVALQLGRPPRGRWAVAQRCHLGVPMAIESHPLLEDGTPFPTLFWLTCPLLIKRAGTLEAQGRMNELNQEVAKRDGMHKRVGEAVDRLKHRRDSHAVIENPGSPPGGGADRIKCLHAHLAHELSDPPNPVGAVTLAEAGWPDCRVACVEVEE